MSPAKSDAVIRRCDYTPPHFSVESVYLTLALYEGKAVVTGRLEIKRLDDDVLPITLMGGEEMGLERLIINEKLQDCGDYDTSKGKLELNLPARHEQEVSVIETMTVIYPDKNVSLEGFYRSGDMYCSQCEPEGFRHITWYPDRPDIMSVFTTRIEAPQSFPILLSNGNLIEEGGLEHERHYAVWYDPFKKPCYLFALVIGDLDHKSDEYVTADGRRVDLRIYVEHGNKHLTDHAMSSLKRAMQWDEKVYGLSYDLDIFMIVAVSHFNMGAMENKGLNIFNSKYVLADSKTASDTDLENVEAIVAHEYFHNWTGNRITCRDWFQLTLKEGLTVYRDQEFTADMHSRGVKRIDDVTTLRAAQFPEDASPTAHSIRPEEYKEINNFYTVTVYEKGAEIIRMIATILGNEGFMKGMALYVERHDGTAATCEDFIAAMADANAIDLTQFKRWYSQAGTPKVTIERHYNAATKTLVLRCRQSIPSAQTKGTTKPLTIPLSLGLIGGDGKHDKVYLEDSTENGVEQAVIILKGETQDITLHNVEPDAVPSLFRNFSAPITLKSDLSKDEQLHLLSHDSDAFGRWDAGQSLMLSALVLDEGRMLAELKGLAEGLSQVLVDQKLGAAEKAQILAVPSQRVVEQALETPDPYAVYKKRREFTQDLALKMKDTISDILNDLKKKKRLTAPGRSLYNRLLNLAVLGQFEGAEEDALSLVTHNNMTLAEAGLASLNQTDSKLRHSALEVFADRWQNNSLVMEKWFKYEASAPLISTPEYCDELMKHPAFDANNPNKLRSVLAVFAALNIPHFHADDGSGYLYIARHVVNIDARNPQIAANLVTPLTRFGQYSAERKAMMKGALLRIKGEEKLSPDTSEIIDKAL